VNGCDASVWGVLITMAAKTPDIMPALDVDGGMNGCFFYMTIADDIVSYNSTVSDTIYELQNSWESSQRFF
jgi:hypothetical protein